MKLSRKWAGLSLLAIAYLVSLFVAFRRTEHERESGRVTIQFCHWQLEAGVREGIDAIIHRYEQLNPRVHVVQVAVPGGGGGGIYQSWILTQMAGAHGPDLVQWDATKPDVPRIFQPMDADISRPNPYDRGTALEGARWRDTFLDGMVSNVDPTFHRYYSVSLDMHLARMVYNKTLMKAITGQDQPPRTYRELLGLCDRVRAYAKARGLNMVPMTNSAESAGMQSWLINIDLTNSLCDRIDSQHRMVLGGDDLGADYLRGDWNYETPAVAASLKELVEFGRMCTPGFWQRERDLALSDFVTGRALMFVAPSWEASNLVALCAFPIAAFSYPYPEKNDPEYGAYVMGPLSDGQLITGMPIYLNRATPHRAEALDFLRFMTSQEGGSIFSHYSNWLSSTIGVKPSAFASQFKFKRNGYFFSGNILVPCTLGDARNFVAAHMDDLWSANGSVGAFQKAMDEGIAERIRDGFRQGIRLQTDNLRPLDVEAAARVELAPPGGRPGVLPIVSPFIEGYICQLRELTGGATHEFQGVAPLLVNSKPKLTISGATPSLAPSLTAGWRALAAGRAAEAWKIFEKARGDADPAVSRGAVLGGAIALLDRQPVSGEQVGESRSLLAGLAEGHDDVALGARFFLGRIAEYHEDRPNPLVAAREYLRLISADPRSIWAQTALAQLAILEMYSLDAGAAPAVRVARAEAIARLAANPASIGAVNFAIAYAILYFRLPAAGALPHLLTAERQGLLDTIDRREVLVQIADISRLTGDRAQAARYYRTFLDENGADQRYYLAQERLRDCLKK